MDSVNRRRDMIEALDCREIFWGSDKFNLSIADVEVKSLQFKEMLLEMPEKDKEFSLFLKSSFVYCNSNKNHPNLQYVIDKQTFWVIYQPKILHDNAWYFFDNENWELNGIECAPKYDEIFKIRLIKCKVLDVLNNIKVRETPSNESFDHVHVRVEDIIKLEDIPWNIAQTEENEFTQRTLIMDTEASKEVGAYGNLFAINNIEMSWGAWLIVLKVESDYYALLSGDEGISDVETLRIWNYKIPVKYHSLFKTQKD